MEYNSALKRKDILTPATTWMNLEDIMLFEINQSLKNKYCVIPLIVYKICRIIVFMET